ncbi:hypothetical protein [Algoriphagus chordae]|uniref:6-bladed beta-propeller protein n=1 Tax=Algoriphagus chordae TaxID=237019 RepID=A0A2W7QNY0_9BACT|nr:hypothetical protein [Algoriphagus chordae]PZX50203.1 hypothetical protein LV85_02821 [Algoriphagus chordae]
MKNLYYLYLLPFTLSIFACSGEKEQTASSTPLSEQALEFEIYDSLIVDYLGNLTLMDISPDGKSNLLIDENTDSIIVANDKGEQLYQYKLRGEGPNQYQANRYGKSKFLTNNEFLIPTTGGVYKYDLEGKLQKKYEPDFSAMAQIIIGGADNLFIKGDQLYLNLPGRGRDEFGSQGIDYQKKSKHIEILDLQSETYTAAVPFPASSKFSSEENAYKFFSFYPAISLGKDSLYIAYRHEPKIFAYPLSDLNSLGSTKFIPFPAFVENEPKGKEVNNNIVISELYAGTINKIIAMEDGLFIVDYLAGLTSEEYEEAVAKADGDMDKQWEVLGESNQGGMVIFNGTEISSPIQKPEILGNLNKYISKDEIWFSLNFSEAENDYSVIYKTRLISK